MPSLDSLQKSLETELKLSWWLIAREPMLKNSLQDKDENTRSAHDLRMTI